jgi:hypothetical protein
VKRALLVSISGFLGTVTSRGGGPFGLHIWNQFDPVTGRLVALKIGAWVDRDVTTIWMDGRRHPSPNAPRTYGGFTTGRWEGNTLVTTTTHMKASQIRRNGAPVSDLPRCANAIAGAAGSVSLASKTAAAFQSEV